MSRGPRPYLAAAFLGVLGAVAALGPGALGLDPAAVDPSARLLPPGPGHWLGTDEIGRDVLARLLSGARATLGLAIGVATTSFVVGTALGAAAGLLGGGVDVVARGLLVGLGAIPRLPLYLLVASVGVGTGSAGVVRVALILAALGWLGPARAARSTAQAIAGESYVRSARALGLPPSRVLLHHVLPNVLAPLRGLWALEVGRTIVLESGLSYLGLGVPPEVGSWGALLRAGPAAASATPALIVASGLLVVCTVLALDVVARSMGARQAPEHG